MKKIILILLAVIINITGKGQTGDKIIIGTVDSVYSGILKEKERFGYMFPI